MIGTLVFLCVVNIYFCDYKSFQLQQMINKFEYIEHRVNQKGEAMAIWPDGQEISYSFENVNMLEIIPRSITKNSK